MSTPQNIPADLPRLPARPMDGHKGTFGTVAIVGGCVDRGVRTVGAPALVARAALRAGCGLAKVVCPEPILNDVLAICPSATGIPLAVDFHSGEVIAHEGSETLDGVLRSANVLAIGPGLGTSAGAQSLTLRAIQQEEHPVIIDADAINCMAKIPQLLRDFRAASILTPHPGEFKRLCDGLGIADNLGLSTSRERACQQLAQRIGCIVVLKGQHTVVADALRSWVCPAGHPCLGTAGTGDVLTGLLAGIVAQFVPTVQHVQMRAKLPQMPKDPSRPLSLFDAACVGVWAHARAGEVWAQRSGASAGLLATELADLIPSVLESLRVPLSGEQSGQ